MAVRRATHESGPAWRARLSLLPRSTRLLGFVLLACAAAPGAARLYAALAEGALAAALGEHAAAVSVGALAVGILTLAAVERPRSSSPAAYVRQLRDRLLELQSIFDVDDGRRSGEGKENEHAVQHRLEP